MTSKLTSFARLKKLGIAVPELLVPGDQTAPEKWAVIACDQFSSERGYWEETERLIDGSASALNLIIPECYLEDGDKEERAQRANAAMADVMAEGVLEKLKPGFMLVNRSTPHVSRRQGLVLAVDLESYDFSEGSKSRIRPTEGTIRDRLPPRMAVRRDALLDLPHILILIDDPENLVMSAAQTAAEKADNTVYDFDLMQGGGHITGRFVPQEELDALAGAFETLAGRSDLLFAVGDGNHSLASAREIWREKKAAGAPPDHPSRYALVEVENIHDSGLPFHPIHRVIFGVNPEDLRAYLGKKLGAETVASTGGMIGIVFPDGSLIKWNIKVPGGRLAVEPLQNALDAYLKDHPEAEIDYIHGEDSVKELVGAEGNRIGIILPDLDKSSFFRRITEIGPYPRKTFSIGEAVEKRYYLEARELT
ncbi:MAG: DUF1015 domain-containing protein [Spirochaetes bacterium]|nr:MAG: DUF1015 domain-containing protein [Spirochaetota bacterium]